MSLLHLASLPNFKFSRFVRGRLRSLCFIYVIRLVRILLLFKVRYKYRTRYSSTVTHMSYWFPHWCGQMACDIQAYIICVPSCTHCTNLFEVKLAQHFIKMESPLGSLIINDQQACNWSGKPGLRDFLSNWKYRNKGRELFHVVIWHKFWCL